MSEEIQAGLEAPAAQPSAVPPKQQPPEAQPPTQPPADQKDPLKAVLSDLAGEKEVEKQEEKKDEPIVINTEGLSVPEPVVSGFSGLAKKYGLSNEQANEMFKEMSQKIGESRPEQEKKMIEDFSRKSLEETLNLPEFKADRKAATALYEKGVLAVSGAKTSEEAMDVMSVLFDSGLMKHPQFARMMYNIGKLTSEDSRFIQGEIPKSDKTLEEAYGINHK